MKRNWIATAVMASSALSFAGIAQADLLVAKGKKSTVTVEYAYVAVGMKKDKYDPREWKVNRSATITAVFEAQKPQALAQLRAMEAGQLANIKDKQATAVSAHKKMTPMMGDMMKIVEKCGENEACIEKEIEAYGNSMEMTPELKSAQKDVDKLSKTEGPRYQLWSLVSQKGSYHVDEFYKAQTADPLCMGKPGQRCRREESRKGGGELTLPAGTKVAGSAMYEVDAQKKDIVLMLPKPMSPLKYVSTVKSDFPEETEANLAGNGITGVGGAKPITVTIPGDLSRLSGTEQVKMEGAEGEGGTLTVRWTITTP